MSPERRRELVAAQIIQLFEFIEIEDRSNAFAEMAPKISRALFEQSRTVIQKSDTQPNLEAAKP